MQRIDFIAVKYVIKPLTRVYCSSMEEFNKIEALCFSNGIYAKRSRNKEENGFQGEMIFPIYLSKDKKIAEKFLNKDPEYKYSRNKPKTKYFAQMLGYPDCCVKAFIFFEYSNRYKIAERNEIYLQRLMEKNKSFLTNNFLYGAGMSLSHHHPCSYNCAKTIEYNGKILEAIRKEDRPFAAQVETFLKMPMLVWFNISSNNDPDVFFHRREQIVFDGFLDKDILYYKKIFFHENFSGANPAFNKSQLDIFNKGTNCKIEDKKISIFLYQKKIGEILRKSRYHGVLIKFD